MEARAVTQPTRGTGAELEFDAVILAGGRGSRLGGASKGDLEVGGRRLVDIAVSAAREAGAARIVVVGPVTVDAPTVVVREEPPFGGPAAGLAAALPRVAAQRVLVLACDLPRAAELVALLLGNGGQRREGRHESARDLADRLGADGRVVVDGDGRTQWLAGLYRTQAIRDAVATWGQANVDGLPVRRLLEPLDLAPLRDEEGASADIDTPEQLATARERATQTGDVGLEPRAAHAPNEDPDVAANEEGPSAMTEKPKHLPPEALDEWLAEAKRVLEIDDDLDIGALLDVAKEVAHSVARPAAPLTTFALGVALGRQSTASDSPEVFARLAELVTARAHAWEVGA